MSLFRQSPCRCQGRAVEEGAFTLIELLVATAVLAVLLTLIVQIVQYASRASRHGQETSEVFSSARAVLDTIGRDLENAVMRDDLAAFAGEASRDGTLAFYARVPGVSDGASATQIRRLSLVRYDHETNNLNATNPPTLMRSDLSITWTETNLISFGDTNRLPQLADVQPRRLCEGVLGFDVVYVHADGSLSRVPLTNSPVRAVRVTLALVDPEASHLLAEAGLNEKFLRLFEINRPAVGSTNNTKAAWNAALDNGGVWEGVPEAARRRMKVYERFIALPQS